MNDQTIPTGELSPNAAPLMTFSYQLTPEEFYRCNRLLLKSREEKNKRQFSIYGGVSLAVAGYVVYNAYVANGSIAAFPWHSWAVFVMALLVAGYLFSYHPFLYEKRVRGVSDKTHAEREAPRGEITLRLYTDHVTETTQNGEEKTVSYEELSGIMKLGDHYLFSHPERRAALFPAKAAPDPDALTELINNIRDIHQTPYSRISG